MKNIIKVLSITCVLIIGISLFTSCGGKKSERMFTAADTTQVVAMINTYMQNLSEQHFDAAFDMILNIGPRELDPIDEAQRELLHEHFSTFPVIRYKVESMEFHDVYDVTIVCSYEFFEKPEGDNMPNTMKVTFKPQKLGAHWYLALEKKSVIK